LRTLEGDNVLRQLHRMVGRNVRLFAIGLSAAAAGCAGAQDYVDAYAMRSPSVDRLSVCHGYNCRLRTFVRIEPAMRAELAQLFRPAPETAAAERARLARAVALFEFRVGMAVGTSHDRHAATTFNTYNDPGQLDCIDETVNTTTYLRLLAGMGLMRLHAVGTAAQRGSLSGFAFNDFITNTAVIVETKTGEAWAVDSYFYGNGREPKIMPLREWRKNWRPRLDDPRLTPVPVGDRLPPAL